MKTYIYTSKGFKEIECGDITSNSLYEFVEDYVVGPVYRNRATEQNIYCVK